MSEGLSSTEDVTSGVVDLSVKKRVEIQFKCQDASRKGTIRSKRTLTLLMVRAALFPMEKTCLGELVTCRSWKVPLMVTETEKKEKRASEL